MHYSLSWIDLIIIIVFMVGIVLFGASFYRKNKTKEAFMTGNQNIPSWVIAMSIFATFVSSISFLALPAKAYATNWNAFVFSLTIPVALFFSWKFFIPLYRNENSVSAYSYLEKRFGRWARVYASTCYLLTQIMRAGTILFLLALPLHLLLGWNIIAIILCTGVAVAIFSTMGGILAVVWTDAIQGIILITGAFVCLFFLLFSMPEGPVQAWDIALRDGKMSLGSFDLTDWTTSTFWVVFAYGIFMNLQNYGIDQNFIQRYMSARSEREAKSSAMFGGLLYLPVGFLFFLIGTSLYAYYQVNITELPAEIAVAGMEDRIFPFFIVHKLPAGLTGTLIASIFAAGMSTVSTSLNSGATIILTDFFRSEKRNFSSRKSMTILYLSTITITASGVLIAVMMIQVKSVLDAWWDMASIFSGGMLGLLLLGYFSKKATSMNAAIAVSVGILVIIWMSLSPLYFNAEGLICLRSRLHTQLTIVIGTTVIFLTGFLLSKFCVKKILK